MDDLTNEFDAESDRLASAIIEHDVSEMMAGVARMSGLLERAKAEDRLAGLDSEQKLAILRSVGQLRSVVLEQAPTQPEGGFKDARS